MEYNRIVAVTGLPGLFEIVSSKTDGALVRSLEDGSTKFVSSRVHNLSHLESIEVYTTGENVNLVDVFNAMQKDGGAAPDVKDAKALKGYFEKVFPELDTERVYSSDMKKMVKWYEVLQQKGIEIKLTEADEESEEDEAADNEAANAAATTEAETAEVEEAPAKKAKAKKTTAASETTSEETPAKKTARKKKTDE